MRGTCGSEHVYAVRGGGGRPQWQRPDLYEGPVIAAAASALADASGTGACAEGFHPTFLANVYCEDATRQVNDLAAEISRSSC